MKPDRSNYETWIIDYLDGALDSDQVNELLAFLDQNPELREELRDLIDFRISSPADSFKNKNSLKKTPAEIDLKQFELLCVADAENDITPEQESELAGIIASSPEKRVILEQTRKAKLVPPEVTFRHKNRLKRLPVPQKIFRYSAVGMSAAAAALLMITILTGPAPEIQSGIISGNNPDAALRGSDINKPGNTIAEPARDNALIAETNPSPAFNRIAENRFETIQAAVQEKQEAPGDTAYLETLPERNNIVKIDYISYLAVNANSQQYQLAAIPAVSSPGYAEYEKPGFDDFVARVFRDKVLKSGTPETGTLKAYEVAEAGIKGINRLFGLDMSLQKNRNERGEVLSVSFSSKLLKFNAPVKKV
jgi:hypothetical protein